MKQSSIESFKEE